MEITITDSKCVRSKSDKFGFYQFEYFNVSVDSPEMASDEFKANVLDPTNYLLSSHNKNRSVYDLSQQDLVTETLKKFNKLAHEKILEYSKSSPMYKLFHLKAEKNIFTSTINWDRPGFYQGVHLDNHAIIVQMIINLFDNNSQSTTLYMYDDDTHFDSGPLEKFRGLGFINTAGATHGIGPVTQNRYTLYALLEYN